MKANDIPSIFDCKEYMERRAPPYHDCWSRAYNAMMPCLFSFAYTPAGRISKYWCSLQLHHPNLTIKRVRDWEKNERPSLPKGYRWSQVYSYSKYVKQANAV